MKIFLSEFEMKKKFSPKDKFIHFTTKKRALRIIADKSLKTAPDGIINFGPSKIYAVSLEYGHYVPKVQITHLNKIRNEGNIVAIYFSTPIKPAATFWEETYWNEPEISIKIHKVLTINQAVNLLNNNKKNKIKDDQDYIIYENKNDTAVPALIYHQTNVSDAKDILKSGFEYGGVLGKGEHTFGIYFAPTYRGMAEVTYNRGTTDKTVMVEVATKNLKLFDTINYSNNPSLPSYKQQQYIIRQNIEEKGIFPNGYDGVIIRGGHNGISIYEIVLTKEAANKNLTGNLLNRRGRIIN